MKPPSPLTSHRTLAVAAAADIVRPAPGNLFSLIAGGRTIKGINAGDGNPDVFILQFINLLHADKLPLDLLVTTFPLGQINEAVEAQQLGKLVLLTEGALPRHRATPALTGKHPILHPLGQYKMMSIHHILDYAAFG